MSSMSSMSSNSDIIAGMKRPVLDGPATVPATAATIKRYSEHEVIIEIDLLKSDPKFQTRIQSLRLSYWFTEDELADKLRDPTFIAKVLLVGTILMLASKGMNVADKSFALLQYRRVQRMHNMWVASTTMTDEQNKYLEEVRNGGFDQWLLLIANIADRLREG